MRKIIPFLILLFLLSGCIKEQACEEPEFSSDYPVVVKRVVDGDTIELATGEKVRLIGIDTPEKDEEYYLEAAEYLESLLKDKVIYAERDISYKDKYQRKLYYLFTEDVFVNAEMIKAGYASSYPYEPDTRYSCYFNELEQQARENNLVIWNTGSD